MSQFNEELDKDTDLFMAQRKLIESALWEAKYQGTRRWQKEIDDPKEFGLPMRGNYIYIYKIKILGFKYKSIS